MNELKDVIETYIYNALANTYTSLPAKVVKVNVEDDVVQSVDCVPVIQTLYRDGVIAKQPTIYSVPMLFPSAGGGILSFPVNVGDTVLLVFGMKDMDEFMEGNLDVPPSTKRLHNMTDAVALGGLYPTKNNLSPSSTDVELKYKGSKVSIQNNGEMLLEAPTVTIKGNTEVQGSLEINGGNVTHFGVDIGLNHTHPFLDANATPKETLPVKNEG